MLVNILYFLILCFVTVPLYSLVVHMGKELRRDVISPELRERLQRAHSQHEQVPPHVCYIHKKDIWERRRKATLSEVLTMRACY